MAKKLPPSSIPSLFKEGFTDILVQALELQNFSHSHSQSREMKTALNLQELICNYLCEICYWPSQHL